MEDLPFLPHDGEGKASNSAFLTAEASARDPACADTIVNAFAGHGLAHVLVFASPDSNFVQLMQMLEAAFDCPVVGCTTAGEIGAEGYTGDSVVAIGLPSERFAARTVLIENLQSFDATSAIDALIRERLELSAECARKKNGFSFLMVDGLSRCEDALVSAIAPGLASFPLFGGSAGDGLRFQSSYVALGGKVYQNAAAVTMVATDCPTKVFSINHMTPAETCMVVTEADPAERIVKSINAEPAAAEYARIIGKDPGQLDELVFAGHPVAVAVGAQYHVRAIQRVNEDGHLVFFSAIDEGMVLTVATAADIATDLDDKLTELTKGPTRPSILGCDCVLRRIEAERSQAAHRVNAVLRKHDVVGFSTYGEQIGTLHVNHTMTGVAIFPLDAGDASP